MFHHLLPLLHLLPAETAHNLTIHALKPALIKGINWQQPVSVNAITFPNPIGIAAGFDKNGDAIAGLAKLGFGFVEIGTVTPRPQQGNPKPRLFRLSLDQAVINRMGFNNKGHAYVKSKIQSLPAAVRASCKIGVNLGKNKDSNDAAADYCQGIECFASLADYLVINISSPNTAGLRDLQHGKALQDLLTACQKTLQKQPKKPPLWLKIAPDLSEENIAEIGNLALELDIQALIISNTTISRPSSLLSPQAEETGGLSGAPLRELATETLKKMHAHTQGKIPLIGVGGISKGIHAVEKINAGASLVQLYSGLIYKGIPLLQDIQTHLQQHYTKNT